MIDYKLDAKRNIERLMQDSEISEKNKIDFKNYIESINVSDARYNIIAKHIKFLFHDINDLVGERERITINKVFNKLSEKLSPSYLETIKRVGKAFVRWHNDNMTPKAWQDQKSNKKLKRNLKRADMISWDDGLKFSDNTQSSMLKALLLLQLDAGLRPSELLNLNYGDIEEKEETYWIINVLKGKTGPRQVIIHRSVPILQLWLRNHPTKKRDDSLWIDKSGERLRYDALLRRIQRIKKKTGFNKPIDLYNFRHSACFLLKMDNAPLDWASRRMGHSAEHFVNTYGRLDVQDDILRAKKLNGDAQDSEQYIYNPTFCNRCKTVNAPETDFCIQCNNPLTMKAVKKNQDKYKKSEEAILKINQFLEDERIQKLFKMMVKSNHLE